MLSEFVPIYIRIYYRHVEKSASLSFKLNLLSLPRLTQGNLREYRYTLTSFRAPPRAMRVIMQKKCQSLLFSTHLFAKGVSQIKVHCHPQRSTPRSARRYAASNDSPFYSTRFLRLGGRAPTRREEALSSSAFHSALRASLHSSEWQSLLLYALFWDWESALRVSVICNICNICKKKENLGVPNGAWKSSLVDDWLF